MEEFIEQRLMRWAAAFIVLDATILTLSPAVRLRTWDVSYRWGHWLGVAAWLAGFTLLAHALRRRFPVHDPYLLPTSALLSGWGMLTVWRLDPAYGGRQAVWLLVSAGAFIFALYRLRSLNVLRRHKYVLLSAGLALTAFTLVFGTNPGGVGPRLWLGCCGVYFQPSEPLKLLLLIYLAAYLADHVPPRTMSFPLLLPTALVVGLALLILLVQQDLGTASLFIVLYTVMLFVATDRSRVLVAAFLGLAVALALGYAVFDVIRIRVDAWLNPWLDPSGGSYQIVQSLIAIANGGLLGRGPGLGSPGLVPISHSDFVFSAVVEETGLIGAVALISAIALLGARGILASIRAPDLFHRYLAAGITSYLTLQSLVIIGGGLRLLPLTGVTLPFLSYGGSSLLTSFSALCLLLLVGVSRERQSAALPADRAYTSLTVAVTACLIGVAFATGWWAVVRGPAILARTDNARRAIAERYVRRGALLDRGGQQINVSLGKIGAYERSYRFPELSPVVGFSHPTFGQAGLESSLDDFLRGLQGHPARVIWWNQLLFGTPPPGVDVRLSLDLDLQTIADTLLSEHRGAVLVLGAASGEILVMASHPSFDPATLDEEGTALTLDLTAPLLNRATQGVYEPGDALSPLIRAAGENPEDPSGVIRALERLGFFSTPALRAPVTAAQRPGGLEDLRVSPLQVALAAASLSNQGTVPAPRIALAARTEQQGWLVLPALGPATLAVDPATATDAAAANILPGTPFWQHLATGGRQAEPVTWLLMGTSPNWQGTSLVCVVALEEDNRHLAVEIGQTLMQAALGR